MQVHCWLLCINGPRSLSQASRQMSFVTTVDIVSTLETHITASVPQTLQVVTVSPSLIAVRINLASMVPPAEATWEDTPVT